MSIDPGDEDIASPAPGVNSMVYEGLRQQGRPTMTLVINIVDKATKMSDEAAQYSRLLAGNDANQRLKRTLHIVNGIICVRGERYRRHSPQLRKFGSIKQKSGPNCLKRLLGIIARATDNGVPSRHLHIKEHEM